MHGEHVSRERDQRRGFMTTPRSKPAKRPAPKAPRAESKILIPAPATLPSGSLTEQRAKYIEARGMGMNPARAGAYAGYANPEVYSYTLEKEPEIAQALEKVQTQNAKISRMTRKKVVDIVLEAIDLARTVSDPAAMIRGAQELSKMCGYYVPEKKELELVGPKDRVRRELALLSEEELIKIATGVVVEGQYEVIKDDRDAAA